MGGDLAAQPTQASFTESAERHSRFPELPDSHTSRITMSFPDSDPRTPPSTAPADCPIFVVDDDPAILRSIGRILEELGYPVTVFSHPQDVLDALPHEGLALLISDRAMPDIDGIELVREVLESDPDLAVIMLTGAPTTRSAADSLRLGVVEYLQKPVSMDLLGDAVQKALTVRSRNIRSRTAEA